MTTAAETTTAGQTAAERLNGAMAAATTSPASKPNTTMTVHQKVKATGNLCGLKQSEISDFLGGMKSQIANVIPKHLTPDRIVQMAATVIHRNQAIAKCTPASLIGAVMQASILGFPPVEALGYCYFVPYGRDVQFQIGYKGYIELARRSGQIKNIDAQVVREGDDFICEFGLEPKLSHKPKFDSTKPLTHVYAVAQFTNGGNSFVVLSRSEVERLRMRSPMQKGTASGPWATDYDAMAKAKALKQLSKYLPLNIDIQVQAALATDEAIIRPENFQAGGNGIKIEEISYEEVNEETGEITQGPAATN